MFVITKSKLGILILFLINQLNTALVIFCANVLEIFKVELYLFLT